ncbi:DUF1294 domain-containing protein [Haloimpatiens sp. FM7330]|uniref:DUF1294 domain-containing protein n=1 Tax=Haloimpatiens sp. FM7330 TaxID=3298610 RepID=UPI00362D4849
MKFLIIYLILINLYGVLLMFLDKYKSKHNKWRIPEKNLFMIALILGSLGIFIGMYLFRHKTKHQKFVIGIPLIMIIQIFIVSKIILKFI